MTTRFSRQTLSLHGHDLSYRRSGSGPALLLIHGMAGSSSTWREVLPALSEHFTVIAPDLPGHGESDKPRGDYSLGAFASTLRDLMAALGHDQATIVGQSLGGGIAMQFAYQYPERCERLVLVSSGGLGEDVNWILRALTLPGVEYVLPVACTHWLHGAGETVARAFGRIGFQPRPNLAQIWDSYGSLADAQTRKAFLHTLKSVVDQGGQRVSATDKLYLASHLPTLIMWGDKDGIIPSRQAYEAHEAIPGSRLEMFEGCGHYPHCEQPERFVEVLRDFVATTDAATTPPDHLRGLLAADTA